MTRRPPLRSWSNDATPPARPRQQRLTHPLRRGAAQEGLTNALRYAAGASVSVVVRCDRDELSVDVVNAATTADEALAGVGTGAGIAGLRRRVGDLGGSLTAGPDADGGWRLSAQVPRRVVSAG